MTSNETLPQFVTSPDDDRRCRRVTALPPLLIGEIDLPPGLFVQAAVPQAVIAELLHEDAPETIRARI
jgi:hypothetical protein